MFTTKSGGKPADLVATTAESTCADTRGFTYNVTDILPGVPASEWEPYSENGTRNQRNTCAVLSPTSRPRRSPVASRSTRRLPRVSYESWRAGRGTVAHSSGPARFRATGVAWLIAAIPLVYLFL
jgi:hypothetical protein